MATADYRDFKIYDDQFQGGVYEKISQFIQGFNAASAGAIRMSTASILGHYRKESIFKLISGLVSRRDIASTNDATAVKPAQDEIISVKLNGKIGPVDLTLDALSKIGSDEREMSFILGQMVGEAKIQYQINRAIMAVEAALETAASVDVTSETVKTMTHTHLVSGMAILGDQASRIVCLVMHSKAYFDLIKQSIADKVFEVAGATIYSGTPVTFNRPVLVTDCPSLTDANGSATDTYNTLALVDGAVEVIDSEEDKMVNTIVTGKENLIMRLQGEFAFNLGVKGHKWDTTNGGVNPTDTAIATASNWDQVVSSIKDAAGARLVTQ